MDNLVNFLVMKELRTYISKMFRDENDSRVKFCIRNFFDEEYRQIPERVYLRDL